MQHDEAGERHIHRFEAFSDIVIGFSLAQLGASLAIPPNPARLVANPFWLFAFLWAFALICIMWLFHHRLFSHWFVPKPLPVALNFAWLAVVVLLVYDTQLAVHFAQDSLVWRFYFVLYTLAYGILAVQYVLGFRMRSAHVSEEERRGGIRGITFMTYWTAPFALCAIYVFVFPWGAAPGLLIWITFLAFGIGSAFLGRYLRRAPVSRTT